MASRETRDRTEELDLEIARYREAAIQAVEQLQWCVAYLHNARRSRLARVLEQNRAQIIERAQLFR
jgi:hypothetical protein